MGVNHDGDSDSIGAIAANLLGAMHGVESSPRCWLDPLELREVIEEMACDLATMRDWRVGEFDYRRECKFCYRYPGS
ncbi:MAG: ADP-ribosylglycohydrolase family protein [Gammaproteobacteria bacterium]